MKSLKYLAALAAFLCLMLASNASFAQVACTPGSNYLTATAAGAIVPGTVDSTNHCDDCTSILTLPFPVRIYEQGPFLSVTLSSNGNIQFVGANASLGNICLPDASFSNTIYLHWDDMRTDQISPSCATFPPPGCGIFTSISGVAPNRIFNIEYRAGYFGLAGTANFEVRLHEADANFEVIYGTITAGGASATSGVQRTTGAGGTFTQFSCNTAIPLNTQVSYTCTLVPVELLGFGVE